MDILIDSLNIKWLCHLLWVVAQQTYKTVKKTTKHRQINSSIQHSCAKLQKNILIDRYSTLLALQGTGIAPNCKYKSVADNHCNNTYIAHSTAGYLSNVFISQEHEILVTAGLLDVGWQGNGGAGGGHGGVELQVVMSSGIRVSDSTCDKIFFVSFSLTLCTFSPRPSTNFDSCNKPQTQHY